MELHIDDLGLSVKAYNCLMRYLIREDIIEKHSQATLSLFANFTYNDLLKIRSLGKITAYEVVYKFHLHGLDIKGANLKRIIEYFERNNMPLCKQSRSSDTTSLKNSIEAFAKKYGKYYALTILLSQIKELAK